MKEKGSLTERQAPKTAVNFLDPRLLLPNRAGQFEDGSRLVRATDALPVGPLTEEKEEAINPRSLDGYLATTDARGRSTIDSDDRERERESILYEAYQYEQEIARNSRPDDQFSPLELGLGITALARMFMRASYPFSGKGTYHRAERTIDDFNERFRASGYEYWLSFFSPSETTQYSAQISHFAVTTESDEPHRAYVEPVIVSADGQQTGLIPEGFVLNAQALRVRVNPEA